MVSLGNLFQGLAILTKQILPYIYLLSHWSQSLVGLVIEDRTNFLNPQVADSLSDIVTHL